MQDDPARLFPNTDAGRQAYIDEASEVIDNIKQHLPEYFGLLPQADLVVKRVDAFREQDGAAQHSYPATPAGARPGIDYAPLEEMNSMPQTELEVIADSKGIPAHQLTLATATGHEGKPRRTKQTRPTPATDR